MDHFPMVNSIALHYVNIASMPSNGNVRSLTMTGCTFYKKTRGKKARDFPFPNITKLRIEDCTPLSDTSPLPILRKLRSIEIIDTVCRHGITRRRFPCLRSVELRGEDTLADFPNLRCPKVDRLILSHPQLFPVRRDKQFFLLER